ncbi:AAA family ATPase [Sedimentibacter sp. MB31-C6]|uniref:AAA family ATPase n=1 Tax=Sedimentibacter sp. MB31-C6 TaxID=3109366 RepID=UPI002DDD4F63|nr:AAA family ATPase [Sedimentibacter sp. MB36-C1]WSI04782.1 AAA family ATPase [Sedimentibacter sp. MB36-C1]
MIVKINMNSVNSFKSPASLTTDKKINLIYGLNGTGKSTISDFLYNPTCANFANCSIDGLSDNEILVYNQRFIKDYFYQPENLKCIFTLSKENKESEEKIRNAEKEIDKLGKDKATKNIEITNKINDFDTNKQNAENKTWEIKTKFAGGVLEYCLDRLKGSRGTLFTYLDNIAKPALQPQKTIDQLKKEVDAIKGSTAQKYELLPTIKSVFSDIEKNQIFNKPIVGNENSTVATLIKKLDNSDWVKEGLKYILLNSENKVEPCPFCQERTITVALVESIENYFDKTYENDLDEIKKLLSDYGLFIDTLPNKETYNANPFIKDKKSSFDSLYNALIYLLSGNKEKISEKIKTPSQIVVLEDSTQVIAEFNNFVEDINNLINEHNEKMQNKDASLNTIKEQFWANMRWEFDQTISAYHTDRAVSEKKLKQLREEIKKVDNQISMQKQIIVDQQKKTVNIEEAIANINSGLLELGIDGFHIEKYTDTLYKIVRSEKCENTFESLSEGEKMIISFLYFRELCKGKKTVTGHSGKKIVVIDDPISSLSHIYIFNIGQMIKNDYFKSPSYEQVFLLTHSLYFFYEMTLTNHNKREEVQKLIRLTKNCKGSQFYEMKYEEIQNDYHSYWFIIKDDKQPPALIANCMRNIIEYFFNFIEKRDLNNVFQKPELKAAKYQAFRRYINRESHSLGQNIFDIKEFDYNNFKEAFRLMFVECGYEEHYKKMMK